MRTGPHGCKWAYVIDLDQNTFEVFGESSETKQEASTTRFNDVGGDDDIVPALLKSFSFSQLPATEKEFMHALKAAMKEKGNDMYREFLRSYDNAADSDDDLSNIDSDDESSDDELSDDEVEIDKEEVDKLLEEGTGDEIDADKIDKEEVDMLFEEGTGGAIEADK